jgi:hypothetical protein
MDNKQYNFFWYNHIPLSLGYLDFDILFLYSGLYFPNLGRNKWVSMFI